MRLNRNRLLRILAGPVVVYALICLFMWAFQRQLLYAPETDIQPPAAYGLRDFQDLRLRASDGVRIQVWRHTANAGYPTIVYFHGNGGNLAGRAPYYQMLADAGFGVLALSYRGYGNSEGSPSEQGFYRDARATLKYASTQLALQPRDIIIYGESIGTGVAVQMATETPCAALVLQSPYTSIDALARDHYPWLPVSLLLKDHFDSLSKISRIRAPLLVFHGDDDPVVPIRYGKAIFEKAPQPKKSVYLPQTGHMDFDLAFLTDALVDFSVEQKIIAPPET